MTCRIPFLSAIKGDPARHEHNEHDRQVTTSECRRFEVPPYVQLDPTMPRQRERAASRMRYLASVMKRGITCDDASLRKIIAAVSYRGTHAITRFSYSMISPSRNLEPWQSRKNRDFDLYDDTLKPCQRA